MPKDITISNVRPLRRHQACRACRQKKLKCDASRPHCSSCLQRWQTQVSVPAPVGYAHPREPQCFYDAVDGLTLAGSIDMSGKVKELEDRIASLQLQLDEKQLQLDEKEKSKPPAMQLSTRNINLNNHSVASGLLATPQHISGETSESRFYDIVEGQDSTTTRIGAGPLMEMLFTGWNPDLPDPVTLDHYIDVFFRCDPCGPRVLLRSVFEQAMRLSPTDPGFPHSAVLHAICASASRWSSQDTVYLPDGTRYDKFAEFHASKTRQYIDKAMINGMDAFATMQALTILSWYFYHEGKWAEVWFFASFQIRGAIAMRLNHPGVVQAQPKSVGAHWILPKDMRDLEARRRSWWMGVMFDRLASTAGWVHAVDERDIGTELPLRTEDYETGVYIPSNPQHMATPDVLTHHPPQYTDPYILLLKAIMLFGRVTDFNVRTSLRSEGPPSKNQNPFFLEGFKELDSLVTGDFLENLPPEFKNNNGINHAVEGRPESLDMYMVHLVPHAAAITLHNPYIDFSNPESVSNSRCVNAARCILTAYYCLSATSLDISRLHPFVTICWYLAVAVKVQLCKHLIETNDLEGESTVWGEINVLRFAMMQYGHRSPIGTRQEKLLQGLMQEVVQMSTQKEPLVVGVPLYPFSFETLFRCG